MTGTDLKHHTNCKNRILVVIIFHKVNQNRKSDGADAVHKQVVKADEGKLTLYKMQNKTRHAIVDSRLRPQSCWHKGCKWIQEILYIVTNLITRGQAQLSHVIHAGGTHM